MSNYLFKLFHPLCDNPQDRCRFDKENTILNLRLRIFGCVLTDLAPNNKLCVCLDFLIIILQFIVVFRFFGKSSLFEWQKYLLKEFCHGCWKFLELLIALVNHVIYHLHYLSSVVSIFLFSHLYHLTFTSTTNEVILNLTFIVDWGYLSAKSYVWVFHLRLRILSTQKAKNINGNCINIFD